MSGRSSHLVWFGFLVLFPPPSNGAAPPDLQAVRQTVQRQCAALSPPSRDLCLAVVQRRLLLVESFDEFWAKADEQRLRSHGELLASVDSRRTNCSAGDRKACAEIGLFERERRRLAIMRSRTAKARSVTYRRALEALRSTPSIVERGGALTEWVCRVGGTGAVACSPVVELLAISDAQLGHALVSDLVQWKRGTGSPHGFNALVDCGAGEVTTGRVVVERRGTASVLSQRASEAIVERCATAMIRAREHLPFVDFRFPDLQDRVFSGLSGFDPFEKACLPGAAGLQIESFIDSVIGQLQEVFESCGGTFRNGNPLPLPPAPAQPAGDHSVWENGITTRKKVENWQETSRSTSDSGVTRVYSEGSTTTGDGREVEASKVDYYRGTEWGGSEERYTYSDGAIETRVSSTRQPGVGSDSEEWKYASPDGKKWAKATRYSTGRSTYIDSDGNVIETDEEGRVISWKRKGVVICEGESCRPTSDCGDPETCNDCKRATDYTGRVAHDCLATQGNSQLCQEFLSASDCCREDAGLADPRIVVPDITGELICRNETPDQKKERCELVCRFARDEECGTRCLANHERLETPTLLERACLYSYSEACIVSETPLPMPDAESDPCPDPLPVDDHFLVPPGENPGCVQPVPSE